MRLKVRTLALALMAIGCIAVLAAACQIATVNPGAFAGRGPSLAAAGSAPTQAMYRAIEEEAAQEESDLHVDRVDYVGQHDNGSGAIGYIFYVYFSDASHLQYERFVRVLRTADGSLLVTAP